MKKFAAGILLFFTLVMTSAAQIKTSDLVGAWQKSHKEDTISTLIFSDKCFAETVYSVSNKYFKSTAGGSWRIDGNTLLLKCEFASSHPEIIGAEEKVMVKLKNATSLTRIIADKPGTETEWTRLDNGTPGQLAGAWLITGRMTDGKANKITPGVRRTMKILSGSRFQWIAYNTDTKEFLGTGGGTYTTSNGKYTENIEFFSRDNSRVGASLQFDFNIEDGNWRHKGFSSKGDPIDEVWTKREKIGL